MYLYESHVWLGLITYGGIILSFIKSLGAEQRPQECEHVYKRFLCVRIHVCVGVGRRDSEEGIGAPKDPFRANIVYQRWGEGEQER